MIRFGTGGWRAVIGEDFICENIRRVAAGIAMLAREQGKMDKPIVLGYDRRFLSENAARWVAETLVQNGLHVWFLRRSVPTPLIMHTVKDQELYFGIEITASHNPAYYNGIKLIVEQGRDAPTEVTKRLEELICGLDEIPHCKFETAVAEVFYLIITGFIGAFKAYSDSVALFGTDLNATGMNTIVGYVYDMLYGDSGGYPSYASAAAIILFAIVLTITVINLMVSRKHVHY